MFTIEFDCFDRLSLFCSEWRQTSELVNLKISDKVRECDFVKNWKWLKLLNSVPFLKETRGNHVYKWRQTSKLVNFQDFCQGLGMRFSSKLEND